MSQILRKIINTSKAPAAIGPYSQAVLVDKTLYLAGSVGMDPTSKQLIGEDIESQTNQALVNMGNVLAEAKCTFANVVKVTVLLSDINDFAAMNKVYSTFFKPPYPARAAYQVAKLPMLAKVEIEAIAIVGDIKDE